MSQGEKDPENPRRRRIKCASICGPNATTGSQTRVQYCGCHWPSLRAGAL